MTLLKKLVITSSILMISSLGIAQSEDSLREDAEASEEFVVNSSIERDFEGRHDDGGGHHGGGRDHGGRDRHPPNYPPPGGHRPPPPPPSDGHRPPHYPPPGEHRPPGGHRPPPATSVYTVYCDSYHHGTAQCFIGGMGRILNVQMIQQRSYERCDYGYTWGFDYNQVWVSRGCKATFRVVKGY